MVIGVIAILVVIIFALVIYNALIAKKVKSFSNINDQVKSLNIVQDFMNVVGEDITVDEKIKKVNDILIRRYNIKYSTIVVFNGAEYMIKACNVDSKHWDTLKNLHTEEIFKDSITSTAPKYITVEKEGERLPYQKMEFERAKSAIFFPLYIDNIYIGYWIIESGEPHAFDNLDTNILEIVRENIIAILKTINYQNTLENIARIDKFTGLYSAEYLYGKGKQTIDKYPKSTVCMFKITNLEEINKEICREVGNKTLVEVSNIVKSSISSEYVYVRYMGPKFVIVFSGVEPEAVTGFIKDIKNYIEELQVDVTRFATTKSKKNEKNFIKPKVNFATSVYYKGTGLEEVTKKLEEYLDTADKKENDINYI